MGLWKEEYISNWSEFEKHIDKLKSPQWIFRGQRSTEWDLQTSFYRELVSLPTTDPTKGEQYEVNIVNEFSKSYKLYNRLYEFSDPSPNYLDDIQGEDLLKKAEEYFIKETHVFLEKLSILQHYGAPTRLLDWTFSPYIAMFFGLDGADNDFCLYALNSKKLSEIDNKKIGAMYYLLKHNKYRWSDKDFLFTFLPEQINERIRIQQGLFLVPSRIDKTVNEILSNYHINDGFSVDGTLTALKFIFKKDGISTYWEKLRKMNITHETLYPGFEGFCKSLKLNIIAQ